MAVRRSRVHQNEFGYLTASDVVRCGGSLVCFPLCVCVVPHAALCRKPLNN